MGAEVLEHRTNSGFYRHVSPVTWQAWPPQAGSGGGGGSEQESFLACQHPHLASSCSHPLPFSQEEAASWGPGKTVSCDTVKMWGFLEGIAQKQLRLAKRAGWVGCALR